MLSAANVICAFRANILFGPPLVTAFSQIFFSLMRMCVCVCVLWGGGCGGEGNLCPNFSVKVVKDF